MVAAFAMRTPSLILLLGIISGFYVGSASGNAGGFESLLPPTNGGAVEYTAVQNGDWNDGATWGGADTPFTAGAPADGEIDVAIPAGITVTVRGQYGATTVETVRVAGTLSFDATVNTQLSVDTIVVEDTGRFEIGAPGSPVAAGMTAEVIWDDDLIDAASDVSQLSKGLLVFNPGQLRFFGSPKTPYVAFDTTNPAGSTAITVKEAPAGWLVGDEIAVAATRFVRSELQSENFRVRAITDNGNSTWTIDLGSLADHTVIASFAHEHTPYPGMDAHIANLTRNIVFHSGPLGTKAAVQRRGHLMSRSQDVVASYAECRDMGRSDKKQLAADASGGTAGANQRGRYSFHFHRNQEFNQGAAGSTPAQVTGCVANSGPGWGFVNHTSVVEFRDCVAWDQDGAGFVCEAGNEVGLFNGNLAMEGTGDPTFQFKSRRFEGQNDPGNNGTPERIPIGDLGFTGDGFWLGSPGVEVINNIAAGFDGRGYSVWNQGLFESDYDEEAGFRTELIDWPTSNYRTWNEPGETHHGRAVIQDLVFKRFENNTAYASFLGLQVRFHHNTNRTFAQDPLQTTGSFNDDVDTEFRNVTTWNNEIGFGLSYIHSLLLEDSTTVTNQTEDNIRWSVTAEQVMSSNPVYRNLVSAGYRSIAKLPTNDSAWTIINPTFSVRGSEAAITYNGLAFSLPNIPLTSAESALWPLTIDDLASTLQDEASVVTVLANDFSPAGEPLSVDSFTQGANGGSVSDNGDGTLTYLPAPGYIGSDSFIYTATDASGRGSPATVLVDVIDPADAGRATLDFRLTANVGSQAQAWYSFSVPVAGHPLVASVDVTLSATSGGAPANLRNQNGNLGLSVFGGDSDVWFDPNAIAGTGAEQIVIGLAAKDASGRIVPADLTLEKITRRVGSGPVTGRRVQFSDGITVSEDVDTTLATPYTFSTPAPLTATRVGDQGIYQLQTVELVVGETATPAPFDLALDLTDVANVSSALELTKVFTFPVAHPWVSTVDVTITASSEGAAARLRNQNGSLGLSVEGGDSDVWFDAAAVDGEGPEMLFFEFVPRNAAGDALSATFTLQEFAVRQGTQAGETGISASAGGPLFFYLWDPASTIEAIDAGPDLSFDAADTLTLTRVSGEHLRQLRTLSFEVTFDGAVLLDDDGDGIANGYEATHGLSLLDPGDAMSDSDGNGLAALMEYGFAFEQHGRAALPRLVAELNPGDGKTYPALELIRLQEATAHADFTCEVTMDLQTFFVGPGATTLVSVTDNGDGTETVVERSNTAITDEPRQFLVVTISPK